MLHKLFDDIEVPPDRKEIITSLAAFALTVVVALFEDWKAADIVWASWLSSLLVGLSFYLIMTVKLLRDKSRGARLKEEEGSGPGCLGTAVFVFMGLIAWLAGPGLLRIGLICLMIIDCAGIFLNIAASKSLFGIDPENRTIRVLLFIPTALFIFFFFLAHFGGFHLGHALFLSILVPPQIEIPGTMETLSGMRDAFLSFLGLLFLAYWPYVLSVALSRFNAYRKALESNDKDYMIGPYRAVIRIHILIFILAPIAMAGLGKAVMLTALFFFHFPIERTVAWLKTRNK